ncbi:MAG: hypothetical protein JWQ72_3431 [Polaromonas sp.]|nr:hypothetical protein [Polaromonas sp.]
MKSRPSLSQATAAALLVLAAGAARAQTPGVPAAAEPDAPASRIGPPVPPAPVQATPSRTTPLTGSSTTTLPRTPTDPSRSTVTPLTPASGTRG